MMAADEGSKETRYDGPVDVDMFHSTITLAPASLSGPPSLLRFPSTDHFPDDDHSVHRSMLDHDDRLPLTFARFRCPSSRLHMLCFTVSKQRFAGGSSLTIAITQETRLCECHLHSKTQNCLGQQKHPLASVSHQDYSHQRVKCSFASNVNCITAGHHSLAVVRRIAGDYSCSTAIAEAAAGMLEKEYQE